MKNEILSELAKKYNPKIDYVSLESLNGDLGRAYRSHDQVEKYRICVDADRSLCATHTFFIFAHELGHIVLCHLGYKYFKTDFPLDARDAEANAWAFKEMGMIDSQGKINEKDRVCYDCISRFIGSGEILVTLNNKCPKGSTVKVRT